MIRPLSVVSSIGAAIALLGFSGCESTEHRSSDERSYGRQADDKNLTQSVENGLKREPVYKFNDVDVKTFAGVVQLSGFVNTEDQKNRAAEIAQQTPGVSQVINNIALKPVTPTPTGRAPISPP
jgi:osmotically-inducible protein OsmY